MERYTIEYIELIRRKSGISYQEAVALLDYHNGNVARALVDPVSYTHLENAAWRGAYCGRDIGNGALIRLIFGKV